MQALWTLENLGALTFDPLKTVLADPDPQVRRNALAAGENLLGGSRTVPAEVARELTKLADDRDAEVRFQLALTLGAWNDSQAGHLLAHLMRRDGSDRWFRAALLSSAPTHLVTLVSELFADTRTEPPTSFVEPLFALAGGLEARDQPARASLIAALNRPAGSGGTFAPWQFSALAGWLDARRGGTEAEAQVATFAAIFQAARKLAAEESASEDDRVRATLLLGRDPAHFQEDRDHLAALLRRQVPATVQQAAINALGRSDERRSAELLLSAWRGYSPGLRSAVLDTLLSRSGGTSVLLASLEDSCTPPGEIDPAHRKRLLNHRDRAFRERAEAVFDQDEAPSSPSRQTVVDAFRPALKRQGDPTAGARTFQKVCAGCHRLGNTGSEVGPDITTLEDRSPEALLVAILDPNRAVEARYTSFNIALNDGRVLTGLIASETATAVTLRRQEGKEDTLLRTEIEAIAGSGQSMMPEGLEKDLTPADFADLVAYLRAVSPR